jgi:Flp pilus assembly protein TadG
MLKRRNPGKAEKRHGFAAVEFAMVAPLLAILITGMLELNRGIMAKAYLSDAARKGARTGIQRDKASADIIADATNIMGDMGVPTGNVVVTVTVTDPNGNTLGDALGAPPNSMVQVQISVPVTDVMWVTSYYYVNKTSLESELMVMMKQ